MQFGEYIHLTAKNYNRYGTNRASHGRNSVGYAEARARIQDNIQRKIKNLSNSRKLQVLENEINSLIDWLGTNDKRTSAYSAQQALVKVIQSAWEDSIRKIDMTNLNVSVSGSNGIGKIKSRQRYGEKYENMLKERIGKLNATLTKLEKDINAFNDENQADKLIADINFVRNLVSNDYQELVRIINLYIPESGEQRQGEEREMIKTLNRLIGEYAPALDTAKAKGDLFEDVLSLIPIKAQNLAKKEVAKAVEEAIKSNNKGRVLDKSGYGIKFFPKNMIKYGNVDKEDESEQVVSQFGNVLRRVSNSPQKIDVEFNYQGQNMKISAKNIKLAPTWRGTSKNITVTSGNPLLTLLQNEDANFVNHYFNLFTKHADASGYTSGWGSMRASALDTIKLMAAYKAMTGDIYGKKGGKAEVFIVNNNAAAKGQPHVKVFSMREVLNIVMQDVNTYATFTGAIFNEGFRYTNDRIEGKMAQTGTARIAKVLNQAHNAKIQVAISSKALSALK